MELESNTATLTFSEETPYAGLSVELNLLVGLDYYWQTISGDGASFIDMVRKFGDEVLLSWNLTKGGEPVPADADGFMSQPFPLVKFLIAAWRDAAVNPPIPLSQRGKNSSTSAVASEKTEAA